MNKWIILLCGVLVACSNSQTKTVKEESFYQIELSSLLDKGAAQKISLDKWSKKIHYIPLETNDSIQIKSINKIILDNDKLLIVHSDTISLSNLDGKYLYDIGRKGEGIKEYFRLYNLILRNDTIFVNEGYDLKQYNWTGTYLGKMQIPHIRHMLDLYPLSNSNVFLGYIDNFTGQKDKRFAFFHDTTAFKIIPNLEKYERVTDCMVWSFSPEMKPFSGVVSAFKELFNDTIYQVDIDYNLSPYAVINLGKYKAKKDFIFSLTPEMILKKDFDIFNDKIAISATGEKDNIIYMVHYNVDDPYTFSFDKNSKKTYYQQIIYPNDQYQFKDESFFVPRFISTDGKYLIDFEFTNNNDKPVIVLVER